MSDPAYIKQITKLLFDGEPDLLKCDPTAVARASASLAEVMGCVIGIVLTQKGEGTYRAVLKALVTKMDEAARGTRNATLAELAAPTPETTNIN